MVSWLKKLRGREAVDRERGQGGLDDLLGAGFWSAPPAERIALATGVNTGAARESGSPASSASVWSRLTGDPAAAALRAQWESRWDEF